MDPALGLVGPGPAAAAAGAGGGAGRASDRCVALVVQGVVGQVVLEDVAPDVLLRPVGERVELPDAPALVSLQLRCGGARRSLLAAAGRGPGIGRRQEARA